VDNRLSLYEFFEHNLHVRARVFLGIET